MAAEQMDLGVAVIMRPPELPDGRQRICDSKPFCVCAGGPNDWDECCCFADPTGKFCVSCGQALRVIDLETGEEVKGQVA
jgi:hypothetical protein